MLPVEAPFKTYTGKDGKPLNNGYVYFGLPNENPITSPVQVYWDLAGTIPAAQPLRTVNGYIIRGGTPANVFCENSYSELVQDSKLRQVFYAKDSAEFSISVILSALANFSASDGSAKVGFLQSGVGAKPRTLQSKDRDILNIADFLAPEQIADARSSTPSLDITAEIQYALDEAAGRVLNIGSYTLRHTTGLVVKGSIVGEGARFKPAATGMSMMLKQIAEGSLSGFTIDGSGVTNCEHGLFVDTDFVQKGTCRYDLKIVNIKNSDNTKGCNGATFFKSSSATINPNTKLDIKIDVDSVTATANGTIGDTGGSSCGILVSFNGAGTDAYVTIRKSIIKNILPAEDSGGVQLFVADHTVAGALGYYLVEDVEIYNAKKRGVKVQAQNTTVSRVRVYGQTTEVGFDAYAINTNFDACRYISGSSTAFRTSGADTIFNRCDGKATTQQPMMRLEGGAVNPLVRDCNLLNSATLASSANNLVLVDNIANATFENCGFACTSNTGAGFSIAGTSNVRFRGGSIGGVDIGVLLSFSSGTFTLSGVATINAVTFGVTRAGNSAQTFVGIDSTIAASIPISLASGIGNLAVADLVNMKLNGSAGGVNAADGSRVMNCDIANLTNTGTALTIGNSRAFANRINKFSVGIDASFTTTAETSSNVTIGTTTPYVTTGFTAFINSPNYSR